MAFTRIVDVYSAIRSEAVQVPMALAAAAKLLAGKAG